MLQLQSQSHVYIQGGSLSVSLARSEFEIEEAQRLRYKVFAEEMGANIVSDNGLDTDRYDEHCNTYWCASEKTTASSVVTVC